jgi:hypothetical protein
MNVAVVLVSAFTVAASAACSQGSAPPPSAPTTSTVEAEGEAAGARDDGDCLPLADDRPEASVALEGTLFVDEAFTHPNGTRTRPYILRLEAPRCVSGQAPVTEVHVGGVEGVELRSWVGRRVRVSGSAMQAMTAWHARSVVLLASSARVP